MTPRVQTNRNALYVIKGEICVLISTLRKTARWNAHQQDPKQDVLLKKLQQLKDHLDGETKASLVKVSADANYFLTPFLDVVRSEETSGRVTVRALSSIEKFISYEIVNEANGSTGAVEAITDSVIHARFVSTDSASDELVLMKILQVLHHLFMSSLGPLLSNESVCELMQSCFRMCFVERVNELLRNSAESALTEMICVLFSRLHSFPSIDNSKKSRASILASQSSSVSTSGFQTPTSIGPPTIVETPFATPGEDPQVFSSTTPQSSADAAEEDTSQNPTTLAVEESNANDGAGLSVPKLQSPCIPPTTDVPEIQVQEATPLRPALTETTPPETPANTTKPFINTGTYVTKRGVKFTTTHLGDPGESSSKKDALARLAATKITVPYGIPCVRELFRFLISLINPNDKQNTDLMIHVGLKLLLVTIETGVESMSKHSSLMALVKNELCKNLFALLTYNPPPNSLLTGNNTILLNVLRIFVLIFDSMRHLLKFQMEVFFVRLGEMISESSTVGPPQPSSTNSTGTKWNYEQREIALDFLVQLWKLPCLVTELYLNYDCDLYCSNLFEETTKLFSKNAFFTLPATGINSIHLLCLDGLVSILDGIENHCTHRLVNSSNSVAMASVSSFSDESNCSSVFYHDPLVDPFLSPEVPPGKSRPINFDTIDSGGGDEEGEDEVEADNEISTGENVSLPKSSDITVMAPRKALVNHGGNRTPEETLLPTHEQLMAIRHKKKILHTGSEQFNSSASKGIEFLQNQGLLSTPVDPQEVARFLRDNPLLDKRAIGDYIANKKYPEIRKAFITSFDFGKTRLDEALRMFLETFRLPGEAPLISNIMEEFASHWSISNNNPFADVDAAYRLGYATIMLNVDQHNTNVKKQGNSMTFEDFKKNLRGLDGGQDFKPEMLQEIYTAIKTDEIVMPAEQTGVVRENYLWKVLLKRGQSAGCTFQRPAQDEGVFDHDLFSSSWGPIVAAMCFIFDKTSSEQTTIVSKCLNAFRKCSVISAHYGMSDVFDHLVISLCKFTTLLSGQAASGNNYSAAVDSLGGNKKAQSACRAIFQLVHRHGDILREGWRNFIDCLVALFKAQLLPKILTESEDFTEPSGRVSLVRRSIPSTPKVETGLFSSIYSYIALSAAESPATRTSVADEEECRKKSVTLVLECRPELLLSESKFLQLDSLQELIKSLIYASPAPESKRKDYDEDGVVFVLEILLKITVQNRDRALAFWDMVREHLFAMIIAAAHYDMTYLLERSVVGLMRVALRLMRKEDLCPIILQSLRILLYLRPAAVIQFSQQMSFGLHEILKTTAANIHTGDEWTIIFTLLEYVGAGKVPGTLSQPQLPPASGALIKAARLAPQQQLEPSRTQQPHPLLHHSLSQDPIPQLGGAGGSGPIITSSSGSDRGYTSDSELEIRSSNGENGLGSGRNAHVSPAQSWILLSQDDPQQQLQQSPTRALANSLPQTQTPVVVAAERQLFYPDPKSLMKSCETLSFLVRDAAHITPDNFTLCVAAIRSFVEASTFKSRGPRVDASSGSQSTKKKRGRKAHNDKDSMPKSKSFSGRPTTNYDADESDNEDQIAAGHQVSVQLLDLLHTLHLRAASIFQWWQKENNQLLEQREASKGESASIWTLGWKPILQAMVILCSDSRKPVRTTALNYLQNALLVYDLQQLSAAEWHSCFSDVLFPLMGKLLEPLNPADHPGMDETRMRAVTLLSRVFLQHLTPLSQLDSFTDLWLQILEFLKRYLHHSERNDLLSEGIPEMLKNLLLVMQTGGVFHTPDGYTRLWAITWDKIDSFIPTLRAELFRSVAVEQNVPQQPAAEVLQNEMPSQPSAPSHPVADVSVHPGIPQLPPQSPSTDSMPSPVTGSDGNPPPMYQSPPSRSEEVLQTPQPLASQNMCSPPPAPVTPVPNFTIQIENEE